jgi:hypothetical protein
MCRYLKVKTAILSLALLVGCDVAPQRVMPPEINAIAAGKAAVDLYDTNRNGRIDGSELDQAPSIKSALERIDANGDHEVSASEITSRIYQWQESRMGLVGCSVRITSNGEPLEGITVAFMPEKFLGSNIKPAVGKTNHEGLAMLAVEDPELRARHLAGAQFGLYRVEITGNDEKSIASQFNTETTLGEEVATDAECARHILKYDVEIVK